ncbi:protein Skeletor, isoforms B/C-like [Macrobrachium rosenbergii]|uniref:protein Skeletor, isoforms B/C-like n=1 Tax=Macrobrachium rosenbergii TaxID=79674 RepID=UPI0034D5F7EE
MASCWAILFVLGVVVSYASAYKGAYIGKLSMLKHEVSGDVYAVDKFTLYIENFSFDGDAPAVFFFAGNKTPEPSGQGFIIPDERGSLEPLGVYRNRNVVLKLPRTKEGQQSIDNILWLSIWCKEVGVDFGNVKIPRGLRLPEPQVVRGLSSYKPFISSSAVTLVDTATIRVDQFTYDGSVPDAQFMIKAQGTAPDFRQVPDENGTLIPLRKYNRKTIALSVPYEVQGRPISHFGVWSPSKGVLASVSFDVHALVPPSIRSLL